MRRVVLLSLVVTLFASCRGISTLHVYPEGVGLTPLPNTEEVYLTTAQQVKDCKITKVADVEVASKTYGGAARVNRALRKLAREKGGNAVISYNFWIAPNGGAWAAPHCTGTVVRSDLNCLKRATSAVEDA